MWCYRRLLRIPWTQHDEWVDFVQGKSWQRTSGSCEIIEIGILRSYDTEIRKSGEGNRSRMCTRLQKSWSTRPALDRWHRWMDWDEDQWSGYSSGISWSLETDTTRRQRQPFLWRKALNDDDSTFSAAFVAHIRALSGAIVATGNQSRTCMTYGNPSYAICPIAIYQPVVKPYQVRCYGISVLQ